MALTFIEQNTLITDNNFVLRIRQGMSTVAYSVMQEDASIYPDEQQARARNYLARRVLNNSVNEPLKFLPILASQYPGTDPDPSLFTDTQYITWLTNNWDTLSAYNATVPAAQ